MMEPGQGLKVFLSYARKDGAHFATSLLAALEAAGFDPFIDQQDIAPGELWEERLTHLLQQADTVVYVVTPEAAASERCAWEIRRAAELSKRLLPVVAIDVPDSAAPPNLRRLNYIFFSRERSFGEALKELVEALRTDLPWIREHTRLLDLARRWSESGKAPDRLLRGSDVADAKNWLKGWKPPSPEPTAQHRDFISESEAAEVSRTSEEHKRLNRERRRTRIALALGVALIATATVGGAVLWRQHDQLAHKDQLLAKGQDLLKSSQQAFEDYRSASEESIAAMRQQLDDLRRTSSQSGSSRAASALDRQARIAAGWDIDVFYCEVPGQAGNLRTANLVRDLLVAEQARQLQVEESRVGRLPIGRVRVRPLGEQVNARAGYRISGDVVRGEQSEFTQGDALVSLVRTAGGPALTLENSGTPTPSYLSVFLCSASRVSQ